MSLNPHIKNLCDKSLNKLFSKETWEKIKNNTDLLYTDVDGREAYYFLYLFINIS
jgi:hypothetical protein